MGHVSACARLGPPPTLLLPPQWSPRGSGRLVFGGGGEEMGRHPRRLVQIRFLQAPSHCSDFLQQRRSCASSLLSTALIGTGGGRVNFPRRPAAPFPLLRPRPGRSMRTCNWAYYGRGAPQSLLSRAGAHIIVTGFRAPPPPTNRNQNRPSSGSASRRPQRRRLHPPQRLTRPMPSARPRMRSRFRV